MSVSEMMAREAGLGPSGVPRTKLGATGTVDATGRALLRFGTPPSGSYWLCDRGALIVAAGAGATLVWIVYSSEEEANLNIEDFAQVAVGPAGTIRVVGEWNPALWIPGSGGLIAVVTGATAGAQASGRIVARQLRESAR